MLLVPMQLTFLLADLDPEQELYVRLPKGFENLFPGMVLRLLRPLYGLRVSPSSGSTK